MNSIFCISGLGADERIFKNLEIKGVTLKHLHWLPFQEEETMTSYALKMASQIDEKNPMILGLSFGGMLATEIAKQMDVRQAFLISSAKGKHELPDLSGMILFFLKSGLIPYGLFKMPNRFLFERFGAEKDEEKELLRAILKDMAPDFLRHAFKIISSWENTTIPQRITHIHGTFDRILPAQFVTADFWINTGTHMMVWNRAAEISKIIEDHLDKSDF